MIRKLKQPLGSLIFLGQSAKCRLALVFIWRFFIWRTSTSVAVVSLTLLGVLLPPSSVEAASLEEIQKRGYLIVGVKDNLRPLGFRDESGRLVGLEVDLAHQLAAQLLGDSNAIVLQPLSNQERLPALLEGKVDLLVARMTITDVRTRLVNFSPPYYIDGTAFLTKDGTIRSLRDLRQQTVAVLNGSDTIPTVRSLLPGVRLLGVDSYVQAQETLEAGRASAFAADASVLTGWVQEDPAYFMLPTLISAEALGIAIPRGLQYEALRQEVTEAIDHWRTEGLLRQWVVFWGLPEAGLPNFTENVSPETITNPEP